ncbi:50S ribosomal protein L35 [Staphylospora marina]|uniref:50S ribosomal protein L35 n=1 Tax=Staphylospora marina TaxID=2490858 RepID=UPI000F5BA669|nr:50S ribosomal protein L35 [Staphylospora marina]
MPKMKTKRAAAKRFKKTGTGKIKRRHAFKNHLLEGKTSKRKRRLSGSAIVHSGDVKRIKDLISYM